MQNALSALNAPSASSRLLKPKFLIPVLVVLALAVAAAVWIWMANQPEVQANGTPISPEMEERFGMRITQVSLSAGGGLLDLRYRVLDPNKARELGHYTETMPYIIDESTGKTVATTAMGFHTHNVEQGRVYYALYRNTENVIKHGDKITIQIGEYRLEHVPVQ